MKPATVWMHLLPLLALALAAPAARALSISPGNEVNRKGRVPEIIVQPMWAKAYSVSYDSSDKSGHGGGDSRLLRDIFVGATDDPLGHAAGYRDGAKSILTGIAANIAIQTGEPVKVDTLIHW